jgi:hypothetical protein
MYRNKEVCMFVRNVVQNSIPLEDEQVDDVLYMAWSKTYFSCISKTTNRFNPHPMLSKKVSIPKSIFEAFVQKYKSCFNFMSQSGMVKIAVCEYQDMRLDRDHTTVGSTLPKLPNVSTACDLSTS